MKNILFTFAFLMSAAFVFAIPGDLNDDGRVDIADLVRMNDMCFRQIDTTTGADLNFDGKVDTTDQQLLADAIIYGKPLPAKLASDTFPAYSSEQTLTGGGLTLNMTYFYKASTIALTTLPAPPDLDWDLNNCSITAPVIIYGLPGRDKLNNASFSLDVPANHDDSAGAPMLLLGFYTKSPHQEEPQWNYRAIPAEEDFDLKYENHKLIWTPDYRLTEGYETAPICMAVIYKEGLPHPAATGNNGANGGIASGTDAAPSNPKSNPPGDFMFEKVDYLYGYGIYRTQHFCIELHTNVSEAIVRELAVELETSYKKIGDLGMPQNFSKKWVTAKRVWVNINKNPTDNATCQAPSLLKAPYIDVPEGAMDSNQRAQTCCHELFHYHQYYHAVHATALFLDEMVGNWAEYLMASNPNSYKPNNYLEPRAVINGLYRQSWAESKISSKHYAGHHGYSLVPFARWLTEIKYPGKSLWPTLFASRPYQLGDGMSALKTTIREHGDGDTLAKIYPEFIRDYFSYTVGIPYIGTIHELFKKTPPEVQQAPIDRYEGTGMLSLIKSPADMFKEENKKHTFSVQNFGAATWRYMFFKPSTFLNDYTHALITFSLDANASYSLEDFTFFAAIFNGSKITLTPKEQVTYSEDNKTARMTIPLEDLKTENCNYTYIGLVATYANNTNPDDSRISLTMNIDFAGPIVADNLAGWFGDMVPKQIARATGNLKIHPVNGTVFVGAKRYLSSINNQYGSVGIITNVAGDKPPKDIMFNITGAIQDATASIEEPSTYWRSEYTGKLMFIISKTSKDNQYTPVYHEEYIFDGENYTQLTDYYPETGNGAKATDILPTAPGKLSRFYIKIPDFDYNAALYNVSIQLPYLEYEIGETVSFDVRQLQLLNLTIYMTEIGPEWILHH
ncbi:MAG: dockerin type I repeat-containing protein [Victivallales bacterium]|nr:dockerin type I repeat-containing protein [Victivallales bacterium]